MDEEKFKTQLEKLKDKILDNVDDHFSKDVLQDILEAYYEDGDYYIIDDMNRYLYWLVIASDLDALLNELLMSKTHKKTDNEYLSKVIKLKSVVDENLYRYKLKSLQIDHKVQNEISEDLMFEVRLSENRDKNALQLNSRFENTNIIENLYELLRNEWKVIDVSFDEFNCHFDVDSKNFNPIVWKSKQVTLLALFKKLLSKSIIVNNLQFDTERCLLISQHFVSKKGTPYKYTSLLTTFPNSTLEGYQETSFNRFISRNQ